MWVCGSCRWWTCRLCRSPALPPVPVWPLAPPIAAPLAPSFDSAQHDELGSLGDEFAKVLNEDAKMLNDEFADMASKRRKM